VRKDILPAGHLTRQESVSLARILGSRFGKVTFAGGEPTVIAWLPELVAEAKQAGAVTMLVSNGSLVTEALLARMRDSLDWLALSADSANPLAHQALGRRIAGGPLPPGHYLQIAGIARRLGIRLKLNTVVTALNWRDDFAPFVAKFRPDRWKVFQVLPLSDQNAGSVEPLLVTPWQFEAYLERHRHLEKEGVTLATETNSEMTGSYLMVDPAGRFFDNVNGHLSYSDSVLDVGVDTAMVEVRFDERVYRARGGAYSW